MCHYISLVVRGDTSAVAATLQRHGRKANPFDNPSIRTLLSADETQFLTTAGHCDCGTVLAARAPKTPDLQAEADRLRRKGWSEPKIGRALSDSQRVAPKRREPIDSMDLWASVVTDIAALPKVSGVGLLVHGYSGDIRSEIFRASRRDLVDADIRDALTSMREDELVFLKT